MKTTLELTARNNTFPSHYDIECFLESYHLGIMNLKQDKHVITCEILNPHNRTRSELEKYIIESPSAEIRNLRISSFEDGNTSDKKTNNKKTGQETTSTTENKANTSKNTDQKDGNTTDSKETTQISAEDLNNLKAKIDELSKYIAALQQKVGK